MSTAPIVSDLQKINPSAIIELFTLTTDATLHGSAQTYRFHNGTSLNNNGDIVWAGNQYLKMPIKAEGFAYQKGQLPRPTLTVSNALGTITAILLNVNTVTKGNDLTGATVTRIRTLARFHNGTSLNNNGDIVWAGNQYLKMPIKAEGFAYQKGQLPRPTLTVSNALGTITAILLNVNTVTKGNDLTGATVTRIRTLARSIPYNNRATITAEFREVFEP